MMTDASYPAWSPNGAQIAANIGDCYGSSGQISFRGETTTGADASWSPTGRRLVFVRSGGNRDSEIWRINADGTELTQLTSNRVNDRYPAWGASGRIAFERAGDIYTMSPRGNRVRRATDGPSRELNPDWSPNGRWITYVRGDSRIGNLYKMRISDHSVTRLTRGRDASFPSWSPDGTKIVFARDYGDDSSALAVIRPNGKGFEVLEISVLYSDEYLTQPDWQPLP